MFHCDVCEVSKNHRVPYAISNKLSLSPFSLVHSNVWGPSRVPNCSGAKWFVSFMDNCTRMTWVYLLKDKATINSILPLFHRMILTQFGVSIKRIRTNNVRDYFNHHLNHFFQQKGIVYESSCVKAPQQNGVAERKMRHILNVDRALPHQHSVPKFFWGQAVLTATYSINRVPLRVLDQLTLFQCLFSHFPEIGLRTSLSRT